MNPLISIITPVYNGAQFLSEAIQSVLSQSHSNWELLIINDGSTDNSKESILSFQDDRIKYFEQENKGVSAARNVGLQNMRGEYFCFLDADDVLPENSLKNRLEIFYDEPDLEYVDGAVRVFNYITNQTLREYCPVYEGNPFNELVKLSDRCFFGPTWMVKNNANKLYHFNEDLKYGEDLLFYITISRFGKKYSFTDKIIYEYREGNDSAMKDYVELEKGYVKLGQILRDTEIINQHEFKSFKKKYKLIMFKTYLKNFNILKALRSII